MDFLPLEKLPMGRYIFLNPILVQPKEIWMVKLADRITNLQPPPGHWDNDKKKKYLEQAGLIHDELKGASEYLSTRVKEKIQKYQTYIDGKRDCT